MKKLKCPCAPEDRYWADKSGMRCGLWDLDKAKTWNCTRCDTAFPFGPSMDNPLEWMVFAFLEGEFDGCEGGFPSVGFHDGYRNYDERFESWLSRSADHPWVERRLGEYAAGALARELERKWDTMQPRGSKR